MEQFHIHAHCVGFPELVVPAVVQVSSELQLETATIPRALPKVQTAASTASLTLPALTCSDQVSQWEVEFACQMKQFVKRCKVSNHTKQIKQISDKVEETSRTILQRRKAANLSLSDSKAIVSR